MALNIRNPEAEKLAAELAKLTGETKTDALTKALRDFIAQAGIEVVPVDLRQGQWARMAFSRFGKGRHRAALNYADCFSYATAMCLGEPLLFKGDDFIHTDVPRWPASNPN